MTERPSPPPGPAAAGRPRGAYAVFRPRRGAWVAGLSAAGVVVVFTLLAIFIPAGGVAGWALSDRIVLVGLGLLLGGGLLRFARLRAVPTPTGLLVVNLVHRRTLEWPEILRVGFSGGTPWAVLELTDTDEVSVMAIQRADGDFGRAEASRLSALVEHHSLAPPPRPPEA